MALGGGTRTIELGEIQGEGKGLDKEMTCIPTREPGPSHVTEVPSVTESPSLSVGLVPLSRELGWGGYLGLEVSVVWLPQKGISAWPRQGPVGSGVAYSSIWGQSSRCFT